MARIPTWHSCNEGEPMTMPCDFETYEPAGSFRLFLVPRRRIVKPKSWLCLFLLTVLWPFAAWAQSPNPPAAGSTPPEVTYGGYLVHQSVEAGYRFSDLTGSEAMFNTMVNLHEGPRILEQSLSMRSENHQGMLFDDLFVNSAGWGGEPNNYLR